jgi:CDP-diacylglycerol--serine O-phosphatidyltransferase
VKKIHLLPNLITLGNAFCGLLALSYAIDGLAWQPDGLAPGTKEFAAARDAFFYVKMEQACFLVFLAMVFDALDGWVARLTGSASELGAQLDSFSDALTFGVTPALLAKVLIEHEGADLRFLSSPRVHFLASAAFATMAILRLARFNLETEPDEQAHQEFKGLPSPAAAGAITSTLWMYLVLRKPDLEDSEGTITPFGRVLGWMRDVDWGPWLRWVPPYLVLLLPLIALLMVSRVRYVHAVSLLTRERHPFPTFLMVVFGLFVFYLAPVPVLFVVFNGFWISGLVRALLRREPLFRARKEPPA